MRKITKRNLQKNSFNAWKRENLQRNKILDGLKDANADDWIIISDLDEIPNLENINFEKIKDKFVFLDSIKFIINLI